MTEPALHDGQPEVPSRAPITPRILVFFDYACQFCYLDWPRFKRLRAEQAVELFLAPFELRPNLPAEGVRMSDAGASHSERVREHMERVARDEGLPFLIPEFVPNTHFALALGEYARDLGPEAHEALHEAIFEAYSGHARDIGARDVVLGIASEMALDTADVAAALDEGRYDDRLHQFYHLALSFGVTATPAALICNELLIGSRPYEVLRQSVERCLLADHNIAEHLSHAITGDDEELKSRGEPESA